MANTAGAAVIRRGGNESDLHMAIKRGVGAAIEASGRTPVSEAEMSGALGDVRTDVLAIKPLQAGGRQRIALELQVSPMAMRNIGRVANESSLGWEERNGRLLAALDAAALAEGVDPAKGRRAVWVFYDRDAAPRELLENPSADRPVFVLRDIDPDLPSREALAKANPADRTWMLERVEGAAREFTTDLLAGRWRYEPEVEADVPVSPIAVPAAVGCPCGRDGSCALADRCVLMPFLAVHFGDVRPGMKTEYIPEYQFRGRERVVQQVWTAMQRDGALPEGYRQASGSARAGTFRWRSPECLTPLPTALDERALRDMVRDGVIKDHGWRATTMRVTIPATWRRYEPRIERTVAQGVEGFREMFGAVAADQERRLGLRPGTPARLAQQCVGIAADETRMLDGYRRWTDETRRIVDGWVDKPVSERMRIAAEMCREKSLKMFGDPLKPPELAPVAVEL